jgi:hypothetical protein
MSLAIRGTSARQKSDEPSSSIGQAANRQVVNVEALSRHSITRSGTCWFGIPVLKRKLFPKKA